MEKQEKKSEKELELEVAKTMDGVLSAIAATRELGVREAKIIAKGLAEGTWLNREQGINASSLVSFGYFVSLGFIFDPMATIALCERIAMMRELGEADTGQHPALLDKLASLKRILGQNDAADQYMKIKEALEDEQAQKNRA